MTKVSLIVPVYNVEDYLGKCLDSIINQSLKDIEIILIDDGSTDSSGNICDEYAQYDCRIRVIHKRNEGLSCARNDGIDASSSPYLMFVDGDDYLEPVFCEIPYKSALEYNADLVLFAYNNIENDVVRKAKTPFNSGIISEREAFQYNVCVIASAWVGLYRRELFDNIRYPAFKYYEDVGTSHRLLHSAGKIFFVNDALYNHRIHRPNSITSASATKNHPDKREMIIRRIDDLCNWGYEEYALVDAFRMLLKYGCKCSEQKPFVEIVHRLDGKLPKEYSWKQKVMLDVFKISPALFNALCITMGTRIK